MASSDDAMKKVSKVYLVRYSASHGDMAGEVADANRIFWNETDAKAFAKLSAEAYSGRYFGCNMSSLVEERQEGEYFTHTETNGFTFYVREFQLETPVLELDEETTKVFSIVEGGRICRILFGKGCSQAIKEAKKFAKELAEKDPYYLNEHCDQFDGDIVQVEADCETKHHRSTFALELKTKQGPFDGTPNYEEEECEWFEQSLTLVEVVYTDVGQFKATEGLEEAQQYGEVAYNWLEFMGGAHDLYTSLLLRR